MVVLDRRHLAIYLRDLTQARRDATPEQKNRLLRPLISDILIDDDKIVGIQPRPEFPPFFDLRHGQNVQKNTPADNLSAGVLQGRKRRDLLNRAHQLGGLSVLTAVHVRVALPWSAKRPKLLDIWPPDVRCVNSLTGMVSVMRQFAPQRSAQIFN